MEHWLKDVKVILVDSTLANSKLPDFPDSPDSHASSVLGTAVLGQLILGEGG